MELPFTWISSSVTEWDVFYNFHTLHAISNNKSVIKSWKIRPVEQAEQIDLKEKCMQNLSE
jgi:hypothetical protein